MTYLYHIKLFTIQGSIGRYNYMLSVSSLEVIPRHTSSRWDTHVLFVPKCPYKKTWYASVMHHSKALDLNGPSTRNISRLGPQYHLKKQKIHQGSSLPKATRNMVSVLCSNQNAKVFQAHQSTPQKAATAGRQIGRDRLVVHHVCKPVVNICSSADLIGWTVKPTTGRYWLHTAPVTCHLN